MSSDDLPEVRDQRDRAWRDLWRALPLTEAGADGLPSAALSEQDAATRAGVERLRRAWRTQGVDVPPLPGALRAAHARSQADPTSGTMRWRLRLVGALTAAAVLIACALLLRRPSSQPTRDEHVGVAADVAGAEVERAKVVAVITEIPSDRFHSREDGVELVSGSVRLVLVHPIGAAPASASGPER